MRHPIRHGVLGAAHPLELLVDVVRPARDRVDAVHVGPLGRHDVHRRSAARVGHHLDVRLPPLAGTVLSRHLDDQTIDPWVHGESATRTGILVPLAAGGPERARAPHVPADHVHAALGVRIHGPDRIPCGVQHMDEQALLLAEGLEAVAVEVATHPGPAAAVLSGPVGIRREPLAGRPAPFGHHRCIGTEHRAGRSSKVIVLATGHPGPDDLEAIHDVNAPSERAEHEVRLPLLQDHVPHGNRRNPFLPTLPGKSAIMAPPQALLGAAPDEVGHLGVLQHALDMAQHVVAIDDPLPLRAPIAGAVEVGGPVVAAVVVGRHVDLIGVVG